MAHIQPNKLNNYYHSFVCDTCNAIAGEDTLENVALEKARRTAKEFNWQWEHPRWILICPNCQKHLAIKYGEIK